MARKTERETEQATEQVAGQTAEQETEQATEQESGQETAPEQNTAPEEETATGERVKLVYFGPSIPFGKLRTSMILEGTQEEIDEYMADVVDKYPEAARLLTTPENLAKAMDKVDTKGNILHKYAQDMTAKIRENREQKRKK